MAHDNTKSIFENLTKQLFSVGICPCNIFLENANFKVLQEKLSRGIFKDGESNVTSYYVNIIMDTANMISKFLAKNIWHFLNH